MFQIYNLLLAILEKEIATHSSILAMDDEAWQVTVREVAESQTWLGDFTFTSFTGNITEIFKNHHLFWENICHVWENIVSYVCAIRYKLFFTDWLCIFPTLFLPHSPHTSRAGSHRSHLYPYAVFHSGSYRLRWSISNHLKLIHNMLHGVTKSGTWLSDWTELNAIFYSGSYRLCMEHLRSP